MKVLQASLPLLGARLVFFVFRGSFFFDNFEKDALSVGMGFESTHQWAMGIIGRGTVFGNDKEKFFGPDLFW